jgi:hypothetical protein
VIAATHEAITAPASTVGRWPTFAVGLVTSSWFCEAESSDRAAQLVGGDPRIPLRRIEMLVAEELLNPAEVGTGAEKL